MDQINLEPGRAPFSPAEKAEILRQSGAIIDAGRVKDAARTGLSEYEAVITTLPTVGFDLAEAYFALAMERGELDMSPGVTY